MSLTRLLGLLALIAGGSVLLSEPMIGLAFLGEAADNSAGTMRLLCTACIVVGLLAVKIGMREEQEFPRGWKN